MYKEPSRLLFCSIHLYEKDEPLMGEFFPGSGMKNDIHHNVINIPIQPLWHKASSSSSSGSTTAAGTGSGSSVSSDNDVDVSNLFIIIV